MGRADDIRERLRVWQGWVRQRLPAGTRLPVGAVLVVGGVFGFLPILGFWMIPLGIGVAALDVKPAYDAVKRRVRRSRKKR